MSLHIWYQLQLCVVARSRASAYEEVELQPPPAATSATRPRTPPILCVSDMVLPIVLLDTAVT
jgi:hypothetical protein